MNKKEIIKFSQTALKQIKQKVYNEPELLTPKEMLNLYVLEDLYKAIIRRYI